MSFEIGHTSKQIIDMTSEEKFALMEADLEAYRDRAYAEERPRAEAQVDRRLEQMRRLGRDGIECVRIGSEEDRLVAEKQVADQLRQMRYDRKLKA